MAGGCRREAGFVALGRVARRDAQRGIPRGLKLGPQRAAVQFLAAVAS
jgi:hypothetical protein